MNSFLVLLACFICCIALGQAGQLQYANMYSHYKFEKSPTTMYALRTKFKIQKFAPATFWVIGWFFTNQNYGGYFGPQTSGSGSTKLIGSVWEATSATAYNGAYAQKFGGEGVGYSVRMVTEFVANRTYQLTLWRHSKSSAGVTWGFYINDTKTGVETKIGEIVAPPAATEINGDSVYMFSEYYGSAVTSCDKIPQSIVIWDFPYGYGASGLQTAEFKSKSFGKCIGNSYINTDNSKKQVTMAFGG